MVEISLESGRYRETVERKERREQRSGYVGAEMGLFLKEEKLRERWEELERGGRGKVGGHVTAGVPGEGKSEGGEQEWECTWELEMELSLKKIKFREG